MNLAKKTILLFALLISVNCFNKLDASSALNPVNASAGLMLFSSMCLMSAACVTMLADISGLFSPELHVKLNRTTTGLIASSGAVICMMPVVGGMALIITEIIEKKKLASRTNQQVLNQAMKREKKVREDYLEVLEANKKITADINNVDRVSLETELVRSAIKSNTSATPLETFETALRTEIGEIKEHSIWLEERIDKIENNHELLKACEAEVASLKELMRELLNIRAIIFLPKQITVTTLNITPPAIK